MQRNRTLFPTCSLALIRTLRGASVAVAILMMIAFFAGCENTKPAGQAGESGIIQEPDSSRGVHGEVGAIYGRSG
jgi:hypothetical protein